MMSVLILEELFLVTKVCAVLNGKMFRKPLDDSFIVAASTAIAFNGDKNLRNKLEQRKNIRPRKL